MPSYETKLTRVFKTRRFPYRLFAARRCAFRTKMEYNFHFPFGLRNNERYFFITIDAMFRTVLMFRSKTKPSSNKNNNGFFAALMYIYIYIRALRFGLMSHGPIYKPTPFTSLLSSARRKTRIHFARSKKGYFLFISSRISLQKLPLISYARAYNTCAQRLLRFTWRAATPFVIFRITYERCPRTVSENSHYGRALDGICSEIA